MGTHEPRHICNQHKYNIALVSIGFFDNSIQMVAQFAQLAKLAQLVQMAQLA